MVLMAGVVLGSMSFFYMGSSAQFEARLNEHLLNIAEDTLEQRKAMPYLSSTPEERIEFPEANNIQRIFIASEVTYKNYKYMSVEVKKDGETVKVLRGIR